MSVRKSYYSFSRLQQDIEDALEKNMSFQELHFVTMCVYLNILIRFLKILEKQKQKLGVKISINMVDCLY
ncbi:MAG: hypothetical protein HEQ20_18345 [Aphanizomenon flos-aquae KM1D3_PB]|nr:MAG: hypothetical protein HEQ20_18345 [Aphanizomenon flos-aquae KM1D3_PB]